MKTSEATSRLHPMMVPGDMDFPLMWLFPFGPVERSVALGARAACGLVFLPVVQCGPQWCALWWRLRNDRTYRIGTGERLHGAGLLRGRKEQFHFLVLLPLAVSALIANLI